MDKISVFYGSLQALWDVSFEVDEGEKVAIVGSNGAGKTTSLKAVSGLLPSRSGSIEFLGERTDKLSTNEIMERGIVLVPEEMKLFPKMTVMENLEMGAYTRRARKKKDENLERAFQLFPSLKDRERQLAETLSGGERQMLAIARGLMSTPKLLMLDEPSLGLAPKMVFKTFETINRINAEGVTILLIEQNVRHVLQIADKAYVLETGRVVLKGRASELAEDDHMKKAYLGM